MPVFDFSNDTSEIKEEVVCTYTTFSSNVDHATIECPILILSNKKKQWEHHSCGVFSDQDKQTAFEFEGEDGTVISDICPLIWGEYSRRLLCIQDQRNCSWRWHQIICRRWFPSVYDRTFIPK